MGHAAHHQHGHIDQCAGGCIRGDHACQGGEEHRGDKQHANGNCGQAGAATGCNACGAFNVAGYWRDADHCTEHAGGAVGLQGAGEVFDAAIGIHQVGPLGNAHQGTGGIEHMNEEEGQHHADHADVQHALHIHGHPGRCQARWHGEHTAVFHQAKAPTGEGNGDDTDQDRAEDTVVAEHGDHQKAHGRQQRAGFTQRAELDQGSRAVNDDTRGFQADQAEEQPDPRTHGITQAHRDAVEQPLADPRQGQDHEQHARDEYRAQSGFPGVAHGANHGVGKEGVEAHARCQADWPVGVQAHQQAAQGGGDTGCDKGRTVIDPGIGHDVRVDENDVGHGDEGRQTRDQFGFNGGAV
ncbi:hypothetical protein D9M71_247140 [compost metagenome]